MTQTATQQVNEKKEGQVTGKIIVRGLLQTGAPLLIGKGKSDANDIELLLNEKKQPYIPGASFAGMFRHHYYNHYNRAGPADVARYFFGFEEKQESSQSHFLVNDLSLADDKYIISLRDGVAIDPVTGIAQDNSLYDYQVLESGAVFGFEATITLRKGFDKKAFLGILKLLYDEGMAGQLRIGAFTSFGFGKWTWQAFNVYEFSFPNNDLAWFDFQCTRFSADTIFPNKFSWTADNYLPLARQTSPLFSIKATFAIKHTLMVSHYGVNALQSDKTHLTADGKPILPGKSIKGAIRHRALKILQVLGKSKAEADQMLKKMMGDVDDNKKNNDNKENSPLRKAIKSRLRIEETVIEGADREQVQPRVKIDRFTGGAMQGALFDSQPLFHQAEQFAIHFELANPQPGEAGLLLLLLKDLWLEDLPIGGEKNIGRGVLKGISAHICLEGCLEGKVITLTAGPQQPVVAPAEKKPVLENLVKELIQTIKQN